MDIMDHTDGTSPATGNEQLMAVVNTPEAMAVDGSAVSGTRHQIVADPSTLLPDALSGQRSDACYVTEWWLPGDEISVG